MPEAVGQFFSGWHLWKPAWQLHSVRGSGESETKCSSWAIVGLREELTSMVLYNRAADRKAHAHAVGFGCVKRLKDRLQFLVFNANSVIFCLDPDSPRFVTGRDG